MRLYKKLEVLIGLSIFDFNNVKEEELKKYKNELKAVTDNSEKIESWYDEFAPDDIKKVGKRITGLIKSSSRAIVILTFLFSLGAAGLLFQYDGTTPINILPVLGLFVFLPLFLLIFSLLIPYLFRDRNTEMKFLEELFEWIKKKGEAEIAKHTGKDDEEVKAKLNEGLLVYSEPVQYFFKKTLQRSAALYALGVILWMIFNVTTTDLAFSWSSTLQFEADNIYNVTNVMSAPWAWAISSGTVDYETVESTRFFRAENSDLASTSSGNWWAFIFMSVVFYSFLPRVITYSYYKRRFEKSLADALNNEGYEIINLNRRILSIESDDCKNYFEYESPIPDVEDSVSATTNCVVLLWYMSDIDKNIVKNSFEGSVINMQSVSGNDSTKDDKSISETIANASKSNGNADIHFLVKIWENPNLRLDNMIKQIVKETPKSRFTIIPVVDKTEDKYLERYMKIWSVRVSSLKSDIGTSKIRLETNELLNFDKLMGEK